MSDPFSVATLVKAASGAMGASIISLFWRPHAMARLALWLSGVLTGAIGAIFGVMFTGFAVERFGLDPENYEHLMAVAGLVGMVSLGFAGWIGNYLAKREGKDIGEVAGEIRKGDG